MLKKTLGVILIVCILAIAFSYTGFGPIETMAEQTFQKVDMISGVVTAEMLNVRKGPGTNHSIVGVLKKNQWVNVVAKIGEWYVVFEPNTGLVGCSHSKFISEPDEKGTVSTPAPQAKAPVTGDEDKTAKVTLSKDEEMLLKLINQERAKAGIEPLKADMQVMETARLKAEDMVKNNYFSHTSPVYGSPFEMMRQYGISYKTAGENIAGNNTLESAVKAWMNSEGHKKNILNGNFNYTGIGIYDHPKYGKILVQQFIGK